MIVQRDLQTTILDKDKLDDVLKLYIDETPHYIIMNMDTYNNLDCITKGDIPHYKGIYILIGNHLPYGAIEVI
jgi:hypothetical protein